MRNRTRQRGSTSVFIVCAIILVLISLAVLYGVRRIAMNDQTPPMVVPGNSETDDATNGTTEEGIVREPNDTASTDESTDNDTPKEVDNSTDSENSAPTTESSAVPEATRLPATGPEDTAITMLALALVASSSAAYVRSRKLS